MIVPTRTIGTVLSRPWLYKFNRSTGEYNHTSKKRSISCSSGYMPLLNCQHHRCANKFSFWERLYFQTKQPPIDGTHDLFQSTVPFISAPWKDLLSFLISCCAVQRMQGGVQVLSRPYSNPWWYCYLIGGTGVPLVPTHTALPLAFHFLQRIQSSPPLFTNILTVLFPFSLCSPNVVYLNYLVRRVNLNVSFRVHSSCSWLYLDFTCT